ncbi:MAG: hypothetical protein ACPG8W_05845 [Candidatus Promineifilaceae bacterium]
MNEQDRFDALLDDALNELPLAPLPPTLISNVMAQIAPAPAIEPFRLRASDIWLALTAAFVVACMLFSPLTFVNILTEMSIPELGTMTENIRGDWLGFSILLVLAEIVLGIVVYAGISFSSLSWQGFEAR